MEIGPILRTMARNKVKVALLVLEIAFTTVITLNCMSIIVDQYQELNRPNGLDEDNIIVIRCRPFGPAFEDPEYSERVVDTDLESIRAMSGIVDATALSPVPLAGGGNSYQVKPLGAPDSALLRSPVYTADTHFIEALGLELEEGRAFTEQDMPVGAGPQIMNIIVTRALADALYPDGNAMGQTVDTGSAEYPDVIVGILKEMHTPYGGGPMEDRITFYPGKPSSTYLVRAEPEALDAALAGIAESLESLNAERAVAASRLLAFKSGAYAINTLTVNVLAAVIGLLLFVTSLGIFGVTSFAVAQRTREIGTRRALGAERWQVVRYFLVENGVIALCGIALGLVGAFLLNRVLISHMDTPPLPVGIVVPGVVLLWLVGLAATAWPARKAALTPPALATRSA